MKHSSVCLSKCTWALACLWCAGLMTGFSVACCAGSSFDSLMHAVLFAPVSFVGLLGGLMLPFLISYLCFRLSGQRLIYAVSFFRAVRFGFCAACMMTCCGSAGWLVTGLLLSADFVMLPLLWWYWMEHFEADSQCHLRRDLAVCLAAAVLSGLIQVMWISPFFTKIMTF